MEYRDVDLYSHKGFTGGGGGTMPAAAISGVNTNEKSKRRRLTERTIEIANVASMNETKVICPDGRSFQYLYEILIWIQNARECICSGL